MFKAKLGGSGPEDLALRKMASDYGLHDVLEFTGWVEDRTAFLSAIDLFVLPSYHEPFGIVLIEAMAHGKPCITTATEGPCEIIRAGEDAMMVDIAKPYELAQSIMECLENTGLTIQIAARARQKIEQQFSSEVVSAKLNQAAEEMLRLLKQDDN